MTLFVGGMINTNSLIALIYFRQLTILNCMSRERSGSVVERLTPDRSRASLRCVLERDTVLAQPRKTCPDINEKLLTGT